MGGGGWGQRRPLLSSFAFCFLVCLARTPALNGSRECIYLGGTPHDETPCVVPV